MSNGIHVDLTQMKAFRKKLEGMAQKDNSIFMEQLTNEITQRVLSELYHRTPTGVYNKEVEFDTKEGKHVKFTPKTGKTGGTLKKNWKADKTQRQGDRYINIIYNPIEYAMYVEYGHRTANHKGWVEGQFMLDKSELAVKEILPQLIQAKVSAYLGRVFHGE